MKGKNYLFYCIAALVIAALISGPNVGCAHKKESSDFMTIEGEPVAREEYQMVVYSLRAQVASEYTTDEANQDDFWEEDGENRPLRKIMDLSLGRLKEYKTAAALAKDLGVSGAYDYDSLKADYERDAGKRENRELLEETVYGPDSISFQSYYTYRHTALFSELEEALKERYPVQEDKLKQLYEEKKEQCTYAVQVETLVCELPEEEADMAAQIGQDMASGTAAELESAYKEAQFYELTMNDLNTQSGKSGVYAPRWEVASRLEEGQVSAPFPIGNKLLIVKCTQRRENGTIPYDEVKGVLKSIYQTEQADKELAERINSALAEYDEQKLRDAAREALAR